MYRDDSPPPSRSGAGVAVFRMDRERAHMDDDIHQRMLDVAASLKGTQTVAFKRDSSSRPSWGQHFSRMEALEQESVDANELHRRQLAKDRERIFAQNRKRIAEREADGYTRPTLPTEMDEPDKKRRKKEKKEKKKE
eukprot:Sspe_Gene.35218::Locus_17079_Transcript_1_1_Confidence_1.000_Length_481::g.35218::m.35218